MVDHIELGKRGEDLAVFHLKKLRYKIIERNYRCNQGEIDVIALDKNILVFVEVKTRSSNKFGSPLTGITTKKQRQLVKTALFYLQKHRLFNRDARFDVVAVEIDSGKERVNLIQNAFEISTPNRF